MDRFRSSSLALGSEPTILIQTEAMAQWTVFSTRSPTGLMTVLGLEGIDGRGVNPRLTSQSLVSLRS